MRIQLSEFNCEDEGAVNRVALAAFQQYEHRYEDWDTFSHIIGRMASLAETAELIVARLDGEVVGAVVYVGPDKPKAAFFEPEWPVVRMLVVEPGARGKGIGRSLTEECISRAMRDRANQIALHTSRVMEVALGMYLRMGFEWVREAPAIHGVPYGVYIKRLR